MKFKLLVAVAAALFIGTICDVSDAQLLRRNRCSSGNCFNSAAWGNSISCASTPVVTLAADLAQTTGTVFVSAEDTPLYPAQSPAQTQKPAQTSFQKPAQTSAQKSVSQKSPRHRLRRRGRTRVFEITRFRERR